MLSVVHRKRQLLHRHLDDLHYFPIHYLYSSSFSLAFLFLSCCSPVWFHPRSCTPWPLLAPVILINHETNKHRNQSRRSGKPSYVDPPAVHIISPWHHLSWETVFHLLLPSSLLLSSRPKLLINLTSTHRNRTGNGTTGLLNDTVLSGTNPQIWKTHNR